MRRRYTRELFAEKINSVKNMIPDAFIGVDIIVGMRGETEAYFEDARNFIAGLEISQLHVFPYSERQGTKALEIPYIVPQAEKHRRVTELLQISNQKRNQFYQQFEGETRPVLFEESKIGEYMHGFTDNYIKVQLPYEPAWGNQIIPTKLTQEVLLMEE